MTSRSSILAIVVLCLLPLAAAAQFVTKVGTEFQVNTYTFDDQYDPAICNGPTGDFIVVWASDAVPDAIQGQRFASDGHRFGTEFQVNTYTSGFPDNPAICCDAAGAFVVTWESYGDQDGDEGGVFGQRFASDGTPVGTEFQVNTYTSNDQDVPRVCCAADGAFTVVWKDEGHQDGSSDGIFGQRFGSNGAAQGTEFQVNTYTSLSQEDPAVCCNESGDFTVVWESEHQDDPENGDGIFGQRYASNGDAQGTEFLVNTYTSGGQFDPEICCDAVGNFVIVWWGYGDQDGDDGGVFGQRFTSIGAPRGTEFQVNTYTSGLQATSEICCTAEGDFTVVWQEDTGEDGSQAGIFGQRYDSAGLRRGGEFQVNSYTSGTQTYPAVACNGPDAFVVVWASGANHDGEFFGIFGQRFGPLALAATPALSWVGLAAAALALVTAGATALRRRRQ